MSDTPLGRRLTHRLHRALVYHGLLNHPYGRDYAREHYTALGGRSDED